MLLDFKTIIRVLNFRIRIAFICQLHVVTEKQDNKQYYRHNRYSLVILYR